MDPGASVAVVPTTEDALEEVEDVRKVSAEIDVFVTGSLHFSFYGFTSNLENKEPVKAP